MGGGVSAWLIENVPFFIVAVQPLTHIFVYVRIYTYIYILMY